MTTTIDDLTVEESLDQLLPFSNGDRCIAPNNRSYKVHKTYRGANDSLRVKLRGKGNISNTMYISAHRLTQCIRHGEWTYKPLGE